MFFELFNLLFKKERIKKIGLVLGALFTTSFDAHADIPVVHLGQLSVGFEGGGVIKSRDLYAGGLLVAFIATFLPFQPRIRADLHNQKRVQLETWLAFVLKYALESSLYVTIIWLLCPASTPLPYLFFITINRLLSKRIDVVLEGTEGFSSEATAWIPYRSLVTFGKKARHHYGELIRLLDDHTAKKLLEKIEKIMQKTHTCFKKNDPKKLPYLQAQMLDSIEEMAANNFFIQNNRASKDVWAMRHDLLSVAYMNWYDGDLAIWTARFFIQQILAYKLVMRGLGYGKTARLSAPLLSVGLCFCLFKIDWLSPFLWHRTHRLYAGGAAKQLIYVALFCGLELVFFVKSVYFCANASAFSKAVFGLKDALILVACVAARDFLDLFYAKKYKGLAISLDLMPTACLYCLLLAFLLIFSACYSKEGGFIKGCFNRLPRLIFSDKTNDLEAPRQGKAREHKKMTCYA